MYKSRRNTSDQISSKRRREGVQGQWKCDLRTVAGVIETDVSVFFRPWLCGLPSVSVGSVHHTAAFQQGEIIHAENSASVTVFSVEEDETGRLREPSLSKGRLPDCLGCHRSFCNTFPSHAGVFLVYSPSPSLVLLFGCSLFVYRITD